MGGANNSADAIVFAPVKAMAETLTGCESALGKLADATVPSSILAAATSKFSNSEGSETESNGDSES